MRDKLAQSQYAKSSEGSCGEGAKSALGKAIAQLDADDQSQAALGGHS
jgi:hypothetical protein